MEKEENLWGTTKITFQNQFSKSPTVFNLTSIIHTNEPHSSIFRLPIKPPFFKKSPLHLKPFNETIIEPSKKTNSTIFRNPIEDNNHKFHLSVACLKQPLGYPPDWRVNNMQMGQILLESMQESYGSNTAAPVSTSGLPCCANRRRRYSNWFRTVRSPIISLKTDDSSTKINNKAISIKTGARIVEIKTWYLFFIYINL